MKIGNWKLEIKSLVFRKKALLMIVLVLSMTPLIVIAGLVPCGTTANPTPCSLCHIFTLLQEILNFLAWQIAPALAILIVAWGGFLILMSGANPGWKQSGIKAIRTAVIGLLIMFAGWVMVNEVLLYFSKTNQESGRSAKVFQNPWNEIKCSK